MRTWLLCASLVLVAGCTPKQLTKQISEVFNEVPDVPAVQGCVVPRGPVPFEKVLERFHACEASARKTNRAVNGR